MQAQEQGCKRVPLQLLMGGAFFLCGHLFITMLGPLKKFQQRVIKLRGSGSCGNVRHPAGSGSRHELGEYGDDNHAESN